VEGQRCIKANSGHATWLFTLQTAVKQGCVGKVLGQHVLLLVSLCKACKPLKKS